VKLRIKVESGFPSLNSIGAEHEPFGLDQATAQGGRGLLMLAGKVVLANRATDVLQNGERLAP
jgi:hypothetical protein